ncbi:MAG: DUF2781 domain-containing protein [Candidatus Peribacteria bacterium]|nr:DUF2781 domain-containing protein [Candidatus Peribacteria bacterium]
MKIAYWTNEAAKQQKKEKEGSAKWRKLEKMKDICLVLLFLCSIAFAILFGCGVLGPLYLYLNESFDKVQAEIFGIFSMIVVWALFWCWWTIYERKKLLEAPNFQKSEKETGKDDGTTNHTL